MSKEKRNVTAELRAVDDSRTIEGYALVFDTESTGISSFTESIDRRALDGVLERSDVICWLDHNPARGALARSRQGSGSLTLSVDDHGLKYRFEAPATALGDEVLEGIRRGDICASSFCFTVRKDEWERRSDGTYHRTIKAFDQLFDVSPVYRPAYDATDVAIAQRGLDDYIAAESRSEETEATEEDPQESTTSTDEPTEETRQSEDVEASAADETPSEHDESRSNDNNHNTEPMNKKKKFSLLRAINDVVNNRQFDDTTQEVVAEGRAAFAGIGQSAAGQIVLPVSEARAGGDAPAAGDPAANAILATVATQGKEAVATEKLNILGPLRSAMVLSRAGATYLTGLVGDIAIPVYSGSNVGWKGEVVSADSGKGSFREVTLKPKRLTAFIDISKQFLIQDSVGAEELLRSDIIAALAEKLESTILGNEAATDVKPAGIFAGVTADTAAIKFADVVDLEAKLEEANVTGSLTYIASPKAKAQLRKTAKDTGSGRFVMEGNEVEGISVLTSSAVTANGLALADWRELIIGQWGGLDLTVDTITKAAEGMVRIVINAYFDAKVRRPAAIATKVLKA